MTSEKYVLFIYEKNTVKQVGFVSSLFFVSMGL
jgi:hypothetical protein